jgi:hypothetical protein
MTPFECHGGDDAATYALGALDGDELEAFRRHLVTCSVCQEEVHSLQQLTTMLATAAPQYPAPKRLRRRVMADVHQDARRQLAAREFSETRSPVGTTLGGLRFGGGLGRGLGPARRPGLIGGAVAVVLVLVVVIVGLAASGSNRSTNGPSGTRVYGAFVGSAQVVVNGAHGELIVHRLKQLPRGETYEVWKKLASGSPQPTSALFNTSPTGDSAVTVPGSLQGVTEIMVTQERSGGSVIPHGKALIAARVS